MLLSYYVALSLDPRLHGSTVKRPHKQSSKRSKERKERRVCSLRAASLSAPVEAGEEDVLEDDGEEEREVSIQILERVYFLYFKFSTYLD
jgi:hypothetical protein